MPPTPEPPSRPRSGQSAKALLLTMLGEFVLPHGGAVWTAGIIEVLGALGVGERNARQAAARLADEGLIASERVGRAARWTLTGAGVDLLTEGAARIYRFGGSGAGWDGRWLVVLASVPERDRSKRHRLRSRLGFAGFGFLGPGVAVSPHVDREGDANAVLNRLGLDGTAVVFIAETGSLVPDADIITRAWDLDGLAGRYRRFVAGFEARRPDAPLDAFAAVVSLVHEWRRFPFDDPEIPAELLPAAWPGGAAKALFDEQRARWLPDANRWYRECGAADEHSTVG